jgi:hypothetical protein
MVRRVDVLRHQLPPQTSARDRCRVHVQQVDLFERKSLRLGDAEVREDDTAEACRSPDEEHLGAEVSISGLIVDEVWCCVTDGEVPEPVGGSSERHPLRTDVKWVDFADDDPRNGTPSRGEESDVNASGRSDC